ncbi:unnamed protein product, partial [Acanthocheilonema viteae]
NDATMDQERGTDVDRLAVAVNPDETPSQVRLECDEVLLHGSPCIPPDYDNNSTNMQVAQLQQRDVGEEVPMIVSYCAENQDGNHTRDSRLMPEQYANGLIHQEEQNVINYVTASQCIQ